MNDKIIVCNPIAVQPLCQAEEAACSECGQAIWLSVSGKAQVGPDAKTICTKCARVVPGEIQMPSEEVLADCAQELGLPIEEVRERLTNIINARNGDFNIPAFLERAKELAQEVPGFFQVTDPALRDENGKLPVDKVFASPGTSLAFFKHPPFETPEDLMNDFDKPDELMSYRPGGLGGIFIIRKSHLGWITQREEIVDDVLKKHGYTQENMDMAPMPTIMQMRREIQDRMTELN